MVMRDGRVIQVGPGVEIVANPADDYVSEFVSDVDRARVLTAQDLLRPALLTFPVGEDPATALSRLADNEANGAFVIDADNKLLGVVTDTNLSGAISRGRTGLAEVVTQDYHAVQPDSIIGDFMHLAGRQVVPVTVVDADGRLAGVVPRAAILSTLSSVREESHA
jgi:glycine betaine/proline transport system ATP-binding protein